MINWKTKEDLLARIDEQMLNLGWDTIAQLLSEQVGEQLHSERVRGAYRRWKARNQNVSNISSNVDFDDDFDGYFEQAPIENKVDPFVAYLPEGRGEIIFGALGDTHLCSKYQRLDALEKLYDIYEREGVEKVFHTGNYVEGESSLNLQDILINGMDRQLQYFIRKYPMRDGITTYYVDGDDHEGWWTRKNGIVVGAHLEDTAKRMGRNDLRFLGYMEQDIPIVGNLNYSIRVMHPGGGSAQAISWSAQKIVSSLEHSEPTLPTILLLGHYHKAEFLPNYKGVYIFQTGTFQEQSPFMRKKLLHADIGAWIIRIKFDDCRIQSVSGDFISFPQRKWIYR